MTVPVTLLALLVAAAASLRGDLEWRDAEGHVLKRIDPSGQVFLYTYDMDSHIVRTEGLAEKVDFSTAWKNHTLGREAWAHCFLYQDGKLSVELDCRGVRHELGMSAAIDMRKGSALGRHTHLGEERIEFTYDEQGRIVGRRVIRE